VDFKPRHKRNLLLLVGSVLAAFWLTRLPFFRETVLRLGALGYLGSFVGGVFYAFSFTISFSLVLLTTLAEKLNPLAVSFLAGCGALLGDYILYRFFKDEIAKDLEPIYQRLGGSHLRRLLKTKYFSWALPVIGAIIIASPLPDEAGITLLGIAKMPTWQFLAVSFIHNLVGIFLIISASRLL
jgi:hypothetical protein